jgi:hypothetical protein
VGHEDDLEAVPELTVGGLAERLLQAIRLGLEELDANHGGKKSGADGVASPLYDRTVSSVLCMRRAAVGVEGVV